MRPEEPSEEPYEEVLRLEGSIKDFFKVRVFLVNIILLVLLWVISAFCYFQINFQLQFMFGDIYSITNISTLSEVLAMILSGVIVLKLGLKITFIICYAVTFVGGILYIIFA
mmetsp:Transcript_7786/g.7247  ORF Transcript_7786/g.7247 Transcript_7786/m.7247 type:complete len:112 (-) Transcript_7786:30-365(-)